jgi:hypothetical protein
MKQRYINALKSVWILIIIFYSSLTWAQPFSGGSNSGGFATATAVANCTSSRFYGGDNAGVVVDKTNLLNCYNNRFLGDANSGAIALATNNQDCTVGRFLGDANSGAIAIATNNQDCTASRFYGDTADGTSAMATNNLNCTNQRFFGDTAGGFTSSKFILIRNFLGSDTTVTVICNTDGFNLFNLYSVPGYSYNWNTANPTAATLGYYQLIATNVSGCIDTAQALVTQQIAKWNGSISNNWHTAANWDGGTIPSENSHVIIPANTPNPCVISESDATAASVQAKTNGSFSIINNRKLFVSGTCISLPTGL